MSSQYSSNYLRFIALRALEARASGDGRWDRLVLLIAIRCEIPFNTVVARIEELAR